MLLWLMSATEVLNAQRYTVEEIGLEEGMPSSRVNDLLEDSRGFFWIGTEGAGLVRYDGFEFRKIDPGFAALQPIVTALSEDRNGYLWFAMENVIIRYDGQRFTPHYLPGEADRVIAIRFNDDNQILVATRRSLYTDGTVDTLRRIAHPVVSRIQDVHWYEDNYWVAANDGLYRGIELMRSGGHYGMDIYRNILVVQSADGLWSTSDSLSLQGTGRYVAARNKSLALLQRDSLIIYDQLGNARLGLENGLPEQDYKGCYTDRSGVVWLFSNSGLVKIPGTAYRLYDKLGGEVFSVFKHNDKLLSGTGKGPVSISQDTEELSIPEAFPFGVVLAMSYHDGYYWLGTESGLIRYDGNKYLPVSLEPGVGGDFVFALYSDGESLWIGAGMGIYRYANGRIFRARNQPGRRVASVYAISEGLDSSLWFATYTQGLFRYYEDEWRNIRSLGDLPLDSLRFTSFCAVGKNELYLGTLTEGVFHVSQEGFQQITAEQLGYAEVRAMDYGEQGTLWLSTNKGIYAIQKSAGNFAIRHLRPSQALMEEGATAQALMVKDKEILAGTENGMLRVDLTALEEPGPEPLLAITEIELFYGQIEGLQSYADGAAAFTGVPEDLSLPHDLNFISFTLAGLTGYEPQNLQYRYRIDENREWTLAGSRREAVFSNLTPGSYVFEAQVARPGESWSDSLRYRFKIKPPLWQQWWFILISVLVIGGLSYWYVRQRIKRINQRLRMENNLMEMERKALRLQMNPHFIFNALDSISSFIFRKDVEQAVRYLNNFAKLMRLTLESSMEHLHPVESEVSILKNYLELEKLRFQGKLDYEISVSDDIDFDVGIPPMLIQPHVENAILHGIKPKEEGGKVGIRFYLEGEMLICEVEDDGIGRKRSREMQKRRDHRSMATEINRHRLELLRKSLGGKVDIRIIDKENPSGTLVRISLPAEQY